MEELKQKLESLEAEAAELKQSINNEPIEAKELSKRAELISLNNRISELQKEKNILLNQSQGKFLFLRVEFYFLLEFVYFLWPRIFILL